jgi:hypothetical protein
MKRFLSPLVLALTLVVMLTPFAQAAETKSAPRGATDQSPAML